MARKKKTSYYLKHLQDKNYSRYDELVRLYDKSKNDLHIKSLSKFLDIIWKEKHNIKPKYLGENTYNNFRGIALEEFCFHLLSRIIRNIDIENLVEVFWNEKIMTEELYMFENGQFEKHSKYKAVDLALGRSEGRLIHPFIIVSCKIWQGTNWLDEDKNILDQIRSRYPNLLGYSLCMSLNVPPVSLISAQRTGLRVFDLSKQDKLKEFVTDIEEVLTEVKKNACQTKQ